MSVTELTRECRRTLTEFDNVMLTLLEMETGVDIFGLLDSYDRGEKDETVLGHVIESICHFLRRKKLVKAKRKAFYKMYRKCKKLIPALCELATPEDLLLDLTEAVEDEDGDTEQITDLVDFVQRAIDRLPNEVCQPITWCFSSFIYHANTKSDVPEEHNLEGKEKLLLDNLPCTTIIESYYSKLINLMTFIIEEKLPALKAPQPDTDDLKDNIIVFLLRLFGKPMSHMDLELYESSAKNSLRNQCETIIKLILRFRKDLLIYLDKYDCIQDNYGYITVDEEEEYSNLYLGTFYYLVFHEGVCFDDLPKVYSNVYVFRCVLDQALMLMETSYNSVQRKGLLLCSACLKRIGNYGMTKSDLSLRSLTKVVEVLPAIMVYSEVRENRQLAVEIFRTLVFSLDSPGRYTVLLNVPKTNTNSGFIGFCITLVKDIVASFLSTDNKNDVDFFTGKHLHDIIKCLSKLPEGVETDLASNADNIISALNLMRYLTLKDKKNFTGIWNYVPEFEKTFLNPLKEALDLSRAHYELEIENFNKGLNESLSNKVSVSVEGQVLPELSADEKNHVLNSTINTFELIDSLRVRVIECIESSASK